ncbi:MAG: DHH family phosphoesterase [Candidatus Omnitrophica bacterium]|nr:DHH family phosphoesterase [Candidatus Omnitrophota bacterium]
MHAIWRVHPADPQRADRLAGGLGVDPITAQLLMNRGIHDHEQAVRFLHPTLETLGDPCRVPDLAQGVDRLKKAIARREPILIFSDSDVDGLTASVILYEVLRELGAVVRSRQSNRIAGGYGLPRTLVHQLTRSSTRLLILVDCGTNQPEDIRCLRAKGIETIVIDHHVPLDGWAQPHALINPHRGQGIGRELCSAGLVLKVAQALLGEGRRERLAAYFDLAALGTLADCAPLVGENRAILAEGMPRVVRSHRPGLRRLCEATRTYRPEPDHILRRLTPHLNASGRLGDVTAAWKLLLGDADEGIDEWMAFTAAAHTVTKQLHRRIMVEAEEQVSRFHFRDQFVMVVKRQGWHQGLMGPLAARLAERYGRPAIALAMDERCGIGSGRSVPLFNLLDALQACQGLLVRFGGHAQACGLTVDRKHLEEFCARVNQRARLALGREGLIKTRLVDLELPLSAIQPRWVEEAEGLAPFGPGNPRPTVVIRHLAVIVTSPQTATLTDGTKRMVGKGRFQALAPEGYYDVVAVPSLKAGALVLTVSDVRRALPKAEAPSVETAPWRLAQT